MINTKTMGTLMIILNLLIVPPLNAMAAYSDELVVENHIQTGDIHVELQEYQLTSEGQEELYQHDKTILPGDTISKIPRITNLAEPCYIRVFLSFPQTDNSSISGLSKEHIQGISDDWILKDDYYYYSKILNTNESIDFFQSVSIPSDWNNEYAGQELQLSIQVDAIQAQNFIPDFTSQSPWGNEEIEICAHNQYSPSIKHPYESMFVEFEGNSHKLLTLSEDFFSNLSKMMPGDTLSDKIILKNTTNSKAEFFFRTELPNTMDTASMELLKEISLEITLNEEKLYKGSLMSTALENPISLGIYKSGETGTLHFSLSLPKTVKNTYALRETSVKWIFSVENEELNISTSHPVKTGDNLPFLQNILLLSSSIFIFSCFIIYKKRKEIFPS